MSLRHVGIPLVFVALTAVALPAGLPQTCKVTSPTASFTVRHRPGHPTLSLNPKAFEWRHSEATAISNDCTTTVDYPELNTAVRGFWTDTDLYLLFSAPYKALNLFLPPIGGGPRVKLWDRDVVEMFLGDDWTNIRHYREFEIAPTADWIDLAIDLDKESYDHVWRSGWTVRARIDPNTHVWYAAAQIPLKSVSDKPVSNGTRWRANLYRIEGLGADPQRHFMCWQPTCVTNRDPNHVPENFGTIIFSNDAGK
jgi:hypothetical protein